MNTKLGGVPAFDSSDASRVATEVMTFLQRGIATVSSYRQMEITAAR